MRNYFLILLIFLITISCNSWQKYPDKSAKYLGTWILVKSIIIEDKSKYTITIKKSKNGFILFENYNNKRDTFNAIYDNIQDILIVEDHLHGTPEVTYNQSLKRVFFDGGQWELLDTVNNID